ncbi:ribonuclease HII [Philodulcilactobacillus myokoensis]|uniref:Ribonuclease HII n=1 Tax=Philodulcilactobacillus myokoensis TaxID=2929573 RepID=A0A9W6B1M9_9LACO|nr:ribonuclease HII [Philodulcilactobacillus myokoensis]GLB46875.1 ribonuclease HII [Philodulcilactobacillus myokoensis]
MTIKEIKTLFSTINQLSDDTFTKYQNDPRKGVQQVIKRRRNQILKMNQVKLEFKKRFKFEKHFWDEGKSNVAGVDEVGRGPLAGPVVTCAVILPHNFNLYQVNDSKQLSPKKRLKLAPLIKAKALDYKIAVSSNQLIDQVNIYQADLIAMKKSVEGLTITPNQLIVDAMKINSNIPQLSIVKGDARSISVAAASIIAKVYRDQLMCQYGKKYPEYDFQHNAGYGTKEHLDAIKKYGITPIHRKTFAPICNLLK